MAGGSLTRQNRAACRAAPTAGGGEGWPHISNPHYQLGKPTDPGL